MWIEQLRPEQVPGLEFAVSRPGTLFLCDTSAGKTYLSMAVLEADQPDYALIIAPLDSLDLTWAPKLQALEGFTICRDFDTFKALRRSRERRLLLLVHFQLASKLMKNLSRVDWDMVIIDEAQGLKARNSGWSRTARYLRNAKRRLALTATPMDDSPIDLYGIMRFVDHTIFGEDFTGGFSDKYCRRGGFMGHKWVFRKKMMTEFLRELEPAVFRLTKDFLNLKPVIVHLVPVSLLGSQLAIYNSMNDVGIVEVDGVKVIAGLDVVKNIKLEQITGGTLKDEEGDVHYVGNAKRRKLSWLIGKIKDRPLFVSCKFLHEIPIIREELEKHLDIVHELHGKIKNKKGGEQHRTDLVKDFQAGKIEAMICQIRTGGVSIEFTAASNLIIYSMNFSLINFEQLIGRFQRGGQTKQVHVWLIYAEGTVDEQIIEDISEKHATFYEVTRHFDGG